MYSFWLLLFLIIDVIACPSSEETQAVFGKCQETKEKVIQVKTGEVLATRVVLKQLQGEDQERAAKKKTEAKKARKLLMKEVENKREDHKK